MVYWCSYQMVLKSVSRKLKLCMYKAPIGKCGHMLSMIILLVNIQLGYWFNIRSSVSRCSSYISFFSYYTIPLGTWKEGYRSIEAGSHYLHNQLNKLNATQPSGDLNPKQHAVWACAMGITHKLGWNFYLYSAILKHEWLFMVYFLPHNPSKEVSHYLHNCAPQQIMHIKNSCPVVTWTPYIVVII